MYTRTRDFYKDFANSLSLLDEVILCDIYPAREQPIPVKQQQKAREAFYKRYSAGKWKMTSGKDIVVNRAKLGREGCKDVIAAAYRYKVAQLEG